VVTKVRWAIPADNQSVVVHEHVPDAVLGHAQLYSSSQENESAPQAWHLHMGFAECGFISRFNAGGVGEVFFVKDL
jgi:hypothetical protein